MSIVAAVYSELLWQCVRSTVLDVIMNNE